MLQSTWSSTRFFLFFFTEQYKIKCLAELLRVDMTAAKREREREQVKRLEIELNFLFI